MIAPEQMHRVMPIGLDQQGRHQTRMEMLRAEELRTVWLNTSPDVHRVGEFADTELPDDTDGYGFAAGRERPVPSWERAALQLADGCSDGLVTLGIWLAECVERHVTPVRAALAVTYIAAGCAVAMVLAGSW